MVCGLRPSPTAGGLRPYRSDKVRYHAYCKPCHNKRGHASREKVGGSRTYHLTRRYGITAAEADYLLAKQGGVCAICHAAPAGHVDHDHATGAVRALLCFTCNRGLGQFKDDPARLPSAAFYVRLHALKQEALQLLRESAGAASEGATRPGGFPR